VEIEVPDGIIARLTRECGGNVHDRHVVKIIAGSFEKETSGANPHSAKKAAGLETDSYFCSVFRDQKENMPRTRNNRLCHDFKEKRIVPTHCAICTTSDSPSGSPLKSWLLEMSADARTWREVAREENSNQLNGCWFTGTFAVADCGECRFVGLANLGRSHFGSDDGLRRSSEGGEIEQDESSMEFRREALVAPRPGEACQTQRGDEPLRQMSGVH
jgi:hypothetical protein